MKLSLCRGVIDRATTLGTVQPRPENPYNDRATMRRRAGYYFTGLAIGLVILGLFHAAKRFAAQQQALEEHATSAPATAPAPSK